MGPKAAWETQLELRKCVGGLLKVTETLCRNPALGVLNVLCDDDVEQGHLDLELEGNLYKPNFSINIFFQPKTN